MRRVLEDGQHQHAGAGRDERGGEPARQHADRGQQPLFQGVGHAVKPNYQLWENVHHSMYPRPRSWSATCPSTSSTLSFLSSFSMQWATNSSTLLYPAVAAARLALSSSPVSILIFSMRG